MDSPVEHVFVLFYLCRNFRKLRINSQVAFKSILLLKLRLLFSGKPMRKFRIIDSTIPIKDYKLVPSLILLILTVVTVVIVIMVVVVVLQFWLLS